MRKATLLFLALGLALATTASASNPVRISQVYGGGGTYYKSDYVELFNNSNAPVNIGGWSVQYGSSTGASFGSSTYNYALIPSGATIPACGYYLVRGYSSTAGIDLPVTPDLAPSSPASWTFNLSATAGKVALFSDQVFGRTCADAQAAAVDMVGFGGANCFETTGVPTSDASSVLVRAGDGAVDSDNNSADFSKVAAPLTIHNSASARNPQCGQGSASPDPPVPVAPLDAAVNVAVPTVLAVAVSDPDGDSLTVEFYGRPVPPPPATPLATAGAYVTSTGFQANWNAAADATSYRLDVATDDGFATYVTGYQDLAVSATHRSVGGLAPETPYYYRVRAVGEGGTSGNSNTIAVTTGAPSPPGAECEVILLPDTQEYTTQENGGVFAMFQAQTQWIANSRASRNIVAVAHEGDITDKNNVTEYGRADAAMQTLESPAGTGLVDGIPYAILRGNHDSTSELFNQYFGVSRFSQRGYYGGHSGTGNDHSYILFSGAGRDFVLVSLSYAPAADALTWAKGVLEAYPNRLGIVVSHSILNESSVIPAPWTSEGQTIFNFLRGTANLRLMLCGHMSNASSSPSWHGEGRRTDVWGAYTIHSVLADYQDRGDGGGGRLRILQFAPAENKVRVRTYSPYYDTWEADADSSSQFTLDVDLGGGVPAPEAPLAAEVADAAVPAKAALADFALLGTVTGVPSGSTASISWAGLDAVRQYEWYVKVSDGRTPTVTGPTWDFTTWDFSTPTMLSRLTASTVEAGIELRWEFSEPGRASGVTVERADQAGGPWTGVAVERRDESGVSIALDRSVQSGSTYFYRIAATVGSTRLTFGPIEATAGEVVRDFALSWPLPNPTSGATRLDFSVPRASRVNLGLYDMQGRRVATLAEGAFPAGRHQAVWNGMTGGRAAPTGIYFLRLQAGGADISRRLVVTR